jgi:hypothetical protein
LTNSTSGEFASHGDFSKIRFGARITTTRQFRVRSGRASGARRFPSGLRLRRAAGTAPGSCRTIPARAGLSDSREATVAHHGPSQVGSSCPLQSRSPCGARSLSSIPPCSVLSASPRSALRLPFGLPSLLPCGARLRFGGHGTIERTTGMLGVRSATRCS